MSVFLSFWWVTCLSSPPPFFFFLSFLLGKPGSPHLRSFFLGGWLPISFFRTGSWLPPSFLPLSFSFLSFKGGGLALPLPSVLCIFFLWGPWQSTPPLYLSRGWPGSPPAFRSGFLSFWGDLAIHSSFLYFWRGPGRAPSFLSLFLSF